MVVEPTGRPRPIRLRLGRVGTQPSSAIFRGFILCRHTGPFRRLERAGHRAVQRDRLQTARKRHNAASHIQGPAPIYLIAITAGRIFVPRVYGRPASTTTRQPVRVRWNNELVRPDPAAQPCRTVSKLLLRHRRRRPYRENHISNAAYGSRARTMNPSRPALSIDAQMAARVSYDRDWVRFAAVYFYASGSTRPTAGRQGFDRSSTTEFAGGRFSYWHGNDQFLGSTSNRKKPGARPAFEQSRAGQLHESRLAVVTQEWIFMSPQLRVFTNANYLWFDATQALEQFAFQFSYQPPDRHRFELGTEYRPFLNDTSFIFAGYAASCGERLNQLYGTRPVSLQDAADSEHSGDASGVCGNDDDVLSSSRPRRLSVDGS